MLQPTAGRQAPRPHSSSWTTPKRHTLPLLYHMAWFSPHPCVHNKPLTCTQVENARLRDDTAELQHKMTVLATGHEATLAALADLQRCLEAAMPGEEGCSHRQGYRQEGWQAGAAMRTTHCKHDYLACSGHSVPSSVARHLDGDTDGHTCFSRKVHPAMLGAVPLPVQHAHARQLAWRQCLRVLCAPHKACRT